MKEIIFVMGSQRSGTNVLRRSLSLDPYVMGFNESKEDMFYQNWALRPERDIRQSIEALPNKVLFKPLMNIKQRPVSDFLSDFKAYDVRVAWIYRNPVDVFLSRRKRWPNLDNAGDFIDEWNRINRSGLAAQRPGFSVVRYEDMLAHKSVFYTLCGFLKVKGEPLFKPQVSNRPLSNVNPEFDRISEGTRETIAELDRVRLG